MISIIAFNFKKIYTIFPQQKEISVKFAVLPVVKV